MHMVLMKAFGILLIETTNIDANICKKYEVECGMQKQYR